MSPSTRSAFVQLPIRSQINAGRGNPGFRQIVSGRLQPDDAMARLCRGVLVAGTNVFGFEEIIVREDIRLGCSRRKQVEDVLHAQPIAADAGPPAAFSRLDRDSTQEVFTHGQNLARFCPLGEHHYWRSVDAVLSKIALTKALRHRGATTVQNRSEKCPLAG